MNFQETVARDIKRRQAREDLANWNAYFTAAISGCDGGKPHEVVDYAMMVADHAMEVYLERLAKRYQLEPACPTE